MSTEEKVLTHVAQFVQVPVASLRADIPIGQVITDSFRIVELAMDLQEEFSVRLVQEDLGKVRTIRDLAQLVAERAE